MQLDRSAERACSAPEDLPLRSPPGAPLHHDIVPESKEFLSEFPLEFLDSITTFAVPKADAESVHPFVRTETNRPQLLLNLLRVRCLA